MDNENKNKNSMREDREEVQTIKTKIYKLLLLHIKRQKRNQPSFILHFHHS